MPLQYHMRVQHAIVPQLDIRTDDAIRPHTDIPPELSGGRNNGGRMDHPANISESVPK